MDIPAPELCALLGNALDNAIEGAAGGGGPDGAAEGPGGQGAADAAGGECLGTSRKAGTGRSLCDNEGEREAHGFGLAGMEEIARRRGGSWRQRRRAGASN